MSDASRRAASGIQTATVFLIGALVSGTALAQVQARITSRSGDTITLSVGAQDGVKAGMIGSVIQTVTAGGTSQRLTIARFTVERVGEASCSARLTQIGDGFETSVVPGLIVELDRPAVPRVAIPMAGAAQSFEPSGAAFAWVPAGTFLMGCVPKDNDCNEAEEPRHRVTLTNGFWMMTTEVTVGQCRAHAAATSQPVPPPPDFSQGESHPVVNVPWEDADGYCRWAGGRLPTEAEWEYAARGGKGGLVYPRGDAISHELANYGQEECCGGLAQGRDAWEYTSPVGSFEPNGYGLYDTAGNVWEWCADWFHARYYGQAPDADPQGPSSGKMRVLRGGSWDGPPWSLRTSVRLLAHPQARIHFVGFRCIRDASP